jgi:hypothetical protein
MGGIQCSDQLRQGGQQRDRLGKVLRDAPDIGARRVGNFLKHADRDHDAELRDFTIMIPEGILRWSGRLYSELAGDCTDEMRVFEMIMSIQANLEKEAEAGREKRDQFYSDEDSDVLTEDREALIQFGQQMLKDLKAQRTPENSGRT